MDKTADSTNRASGPQLKREQAAILAHYELMHGLALISNLRLRKYLGLIEAQRAKKTVEEDPLETLRKAMRQEASIKPKAFFEPSPAKVSRLDRSPTLRQENG